MRDEDFCEFVLDDGAGDECGRPSDAVIMAGPVLGVKRPWGCCRDHLDALAQVFVQLGWAPPL